MLRPARVVLVLLLAGLASTVAAQDPAAPKPPAVGPTSEPPTEVTIDKNTQAVAGVGFSGPLGGVVTFELLHGLGADVREGKERVQIVCAAPIPYCAGGFFLKATAGSGGGRLGIGAGARARIHADEAKGAVTAGLLLSVARTWGSPIGTEPGLTYLGPELDLSVMHVALDLGVLWRIHGDRGDRLLFSWGIGLRL